MLCDSCGKFVADGKSVCPRCGEHCPGTDADPFAGQSFDAALGLESLAPSAESDDLLNYSFGLDIPHQSGAVRSTEGAPWDLLKGNLDSGVLAQTLAMPKVAEIGSDALSMPTGEVLPGLPSLSASNVPGAGVAVKGNTAGALASVGQGKPTVAQAQQGRPVANEVLATGAAALIGAVEVERRKKKKAKQSGRDLGVSKRLRQLKGLHSEGLAALLGKALDGGESLPLDEWKQILSGCDLEIRAQIKEITWLRDTIQELLRAGARFNPQLHEKISEQDGTVLDAFDDLATLGESLHSCRDMLEPAADRSGKRKIEVANLLERKDMLLQVASQSVDVFERIQKVRTWWNTHRLALNKMAADILREDVQRFPHQELPDCEPLLLLTQGLATSNKSSRVGSDPAEISTYLMWSLVNTFVCCPLVGLGALFYSVRCYYAKRAGQTELAESMSNKALECNICSLIVALVFWCMMIMSDD